VVDFHQPKALLAGRLVLAVAVTAALVRRVGKKEDPTSPAERIPGPIGAQE